MTSDFFNAKELLKRDIHNVNRFFRNKGADVIDDETIFEETVNGFPGDDDDEAEASDDEYDEEEE